MLESSADLAREKRPPPTDYRTPRMHVVPEYKRLAAGARKPYESNAPKKRLGRMGASPKRCETERRLAIWRQKASHSLERYSPRWLLFVLLRFVSYGVIAANLLSLMWRKTHAT